MMYVIGKTNKLNKTEETVVNGMITQVTEQNVEICMHVNT